MKEQKQGKEVVNNPPHYRSRVSANKMKAIIDRIVKRGYIEAIDVIDAFALNFTLGSVVKYILRCGEKDDAVIELEKSAWYVNHEKEMRSV